MWINFETSKRYVPHCSRAASDARPLTVPPVWSAAGGRGSNSRSTLSSNLQPCSRSLFSPKTSTAIHRVSVLRHPKTRLESTADVVWPELRLSRSGDILLRINNPVPRHFRPFCAIVATCSLLRSPSCCPGIGACDNPHQADFILQPTQHLVIEHPHFQRPIRGVMRIDG